MTISRDPGRAPRSTLPAQTGALRRDEAHFANIVAVWNRYVRAHGGELPADPYEMLLDSGATDGMRELRWYAFLLYVPPRINPDLPLNDKLLLFVWDRPDLGEQWGCYADGTWGRADVRNAPALGRAAGMQPDPMSKFKAAGYPVWRWASLGERASWLAENRDRLIWDAGLRMYVVPPNPGSRPAAPEPRPVGQH